MTTSPGGAVPPRASATGSRLDLGTHVRALTRFWRSVVVLTLLGLLGGWALSATTTPLYETSTTYFAASAGDATGDALTNDEFAQRRINSYIGVVTSERIAELVIADAGVDLDVEGVMSRIQASAQTDTVLLEVTVRDDDAERSLLIAESLEQNLDSAIKSIDATGGDTEVQLTAISGPTLSSSPVVPRTSLNLAIGLLAGLGLGVISALLREQLDQTVRNRAQLAQVSQKPVLGVLAYDRRAKRQPILSQPNQQTRRAESFRHLRTSLSFLDAAQPVKVLVITSTTEREGKSSTAANLAITMAASGGRILLVDADLRRPSIHRYLRVEGAVGLTNVLTHEFEIREVIQPLGQHGLDVMASGPLPPNPSELLGGATMATVLSTVREQYDMVVIDTPPLLPVTDAAVLAAHADGAVMVLRQGSTKRTQFMHCIEMIENVNARFLGSILTMAKDSADQEESSYYRRQRRRGLR